MTPFNFYKLFIIGFLFLLLVHCTRNNIKFNQNYNEAKNNVFYNQWIENYKAKASIAIKVPKRTLDDIFKNVNYNEKIITYYNKQPEFQLTYQQYNSRYISDKKISEGKSFIKKHWGSLYKVEKIYKIPVSLIVALLGAESNYGYFKLNFKASEALSTLAFNSRRKEFFEGELNHLVMLVNKGYLEPDAKSSWAGALGAPQFMPSNYFNYGVDSSNKGKVDLINNYDDIFYSVGNFLRFLGWNYNNTWGTEVVLPNNFNNKLIKVSEKPVYEWFNMGVKKLSKKSKINISSLATIIVVDQNRAFLVTSNFKVIMKWNRSELFALTVLDMSDIFNNYIIKEGFKNRK